MNCRFCGTGLPAGALFCGECGRPVAAPVAAPVPVAAVPAVPASAAPVPPPAGIPAAHAAFAPRIAATPVEVEFSCPQCGAAVSDDEVFCGECGFVLHVSGGGLPEPEPEDPRVEERPAEPDASRNPPTGQQEPEPVEEPDPEPVEEPDPEPMEEPDPDPFPWGRSPRSGAVDLEATRVSAAPLPEERFVLQFSTGESVTVSGAGLVGRNPAAQPGEYVDQLVTIFDAGKSVSKTHLEFGQDGGRFWVSDRYSTNGSTVRQPDAEPRRCEPGRRYFVARGTRVDIGDQFFVVS